MYLSLTITLILYLSWIREWERTMQSVLHMSICGSSIQVVWINLYDILVQLLLNYVTLRTNNSDN